MNTEFSESRFGRYLGCDDDKLERLKKIVDETGAKIVVSSTWRLDITRKGCWIDGIYQYLLDNLKRYGLEVFDITPDLSRNGSLRGKEIHTWLEAHKDLDIDSWVVLDDEWFWDFAYPEYQIRRHLVETSFYMRNGGLQDEHVEKALYILNGGNAYDYNKGLEDGN